MKKKLKYLNEAGFSKEEQKRIKKWIHPWIKEFIKRGDNPVYHVKKCDFKKDDLFFFTTCHDLINKGGHDNKMKIRKRKRQVLLSLFLRQLIGDKINIETIACTHCGSPEIDIIGVNGGYYRHCHACGNLILDTFADFAHVSFVEMAGNVKEFYEKQN